MARNWVLVTLIGFVLGGSVLCFCWWSYRRYILGSGSATSELSSWKTMSLRSRLPFWRRVSAQKEYELVSRHEV